MIEMNYQLPSQDKRDYLERQQALNIVNGFDDVVDATWEWLQLDSTANFFFDKQGRITRFFRESGIEDKWDSIIEERALRGVDITEEIYEYARNLNTDADIHYTPQETAVFNKLCDNSYELIRNVGEDQIRGIRQRLVRDYANGVNPRQTSLREVQLEPINGYSPEARAVMIARTETARALNCGMLEQYRRDGIEFVTLLVSSDCDECLQYAQEDDGSEKLVPIGEALDAPCIHPNCRCAWVPATGQTVQ